MIEFYEIILDKTLYTILLNRIAIKSSIRLVSSNVHEHPHFFGLEGVALIDIYIITLKKECKEYHNALPKLPILGSRRRVKIDFKTNLPTDLFGLTVFFSIDLIREKII